MEPRPFDRPRTLWLLKFKSPEAGSGSSSVDFFIPSPFGNNEWISANPQDNLKAQDLLGKIQKKCNDLKSECTAVQKLEPSGQRLDKAQELFKDFKSLDEMMKNFSDFIKRFYRIKPDEEEKKQ